MDVVAVGKQMAIARPSLWGNSVWSRPNRRTFFIEIKTAKAHSALDGMTGRIVSPIINI